MAAADIGVRLLGKLPVRRFDLGRLEFAVDKKLQQRPLLFLVASLGRGRASSLSPVGTRKLFIELFLGFTAVFNRLFLQPRPVVLPSLTGHDHTGGKAIFPVSTIDEWIAILTGVEAGEADGEGNYPEESVNGKVIAQLRSFTDTLLKLRKSKEKEEDEGESENDGG